MSEPLLELQKALRGRFIDTPQITALVPADQIFDRNARPELYPCILLGEGQASYAHPYDTFYDEAFTDLHVWTEENSLTAVKAIAGAIRAALRTPLTVEGFRLSDLQISSRFLRDPDGAHAHGVVSVRAIMQELAA